MSTTIRYGVACAGNWLVEDRYSVAHYPAEGQMARITQAQRNLGGCAYHVTRYLHDLDPDLFLYAIGVIGEDKEGHEILDDLHDRDMDTFQLIAQPGVNTAHAEVIVAADSGRRTSFYRAGGNALLSPAHFDFSHCSAAWLHVGSLLLLDLLDGPDVEFGTRTARVLDVARAAGLTTSVDVICDEQADYAAMVWPALPYVDFLIVNEAAARRCSEPLRAERSGSEGGETGVATCAERLLAKGVQQAVVIHFPVGAVAAAKGGGPLFVPSLQLPPERIHNHSGAGHAFCAAFIYATLQGWPLEERLQFGHCVAAHHLLQTDPQGGLPMGEKNLELLEKFPPRGGTNGSGQSIAI